jgi:hypothetical protein
MAFIYGQSFNNFAAATVAQLAREFTVISTFTTLAFIAGRFTGNALDARGSTGSALVTALGGNKPTVIVGLAYRRTSPFNLGRIFALVDGAIFHFELRMESSGQITARRGASGTILGTTAFALPIGVWCHIEAKVFISDTVGTVEVRVNGITVLLLTAQDTRNGGNASCDQVYLGPSSSAESGAYDDYHICDDTIVEAANPLNDFLGEVKWKSLYPSAAGPNTDFSVVGAASNFDAVNDAIPTDDTKYVAADTVLKRDTYEIADINAGDTVKVVSLKHLARKTDAGLATLKPVIISGGTTDIPATGKIVLDTYSYFATNKALDPDTGLPWTAAAVNAMKAGQEFAIV